MNTAAQLTPSVAATWIEQTALRELHAAADNRLRSNLGMHLNVTEGILMSAFSHDPSIVLSA